MTNNSELISSLHPLERKLLPHLKKYSLFEDLVKNSGMQEVEVMRALQWLQSKNVLEIKTESETIVLLDINGETYKKEGLPERRLIKALHEGELTLKQIEQKTKLSQNELSSCLGTLRKKNLIEIRKEQEMTLKLTEAGKHYVLNEHFPEEHLLKREFPLKLSELNQEEKQILEELKRKRILLVEEKKKKTAELTSLGKSLLKEEIKQDVIDSLTPEIIKKQEWKNKNFRKYDLKATVPKINAGKLQHYKKFLDDVRTKFTTLGFEEMTGPLVESDFWDMDALFMPQDHSARDIHEAYYIKEPKTAEIDKKILERVKAAHEKGWGYKFSIEKTQQTLLRTQTTACSSRKLASPDLKIPGKYFAIARNFRYDVIDATHLPDFHQVEGIVVEEGLTLKHLFGLLKMFAKEFAETEEIKLVPGYFPFTEPSVELFAKHPQLGWVELGGAGIFRPEVVEPLTGKKISVIAWGLGVDRLGMFKLGIKDIRSLFSQNIEELRESKIV
ncbi:phenylalanine--tRNA ligase subunit alpha [Candidatus Woesearchaeota archaeon]|nr:phenylalanine--tRNA ligase subunit alpha [Candidatus Woesearchaeota archaeon]